MKTTSYQLTFGFRDAQLPAKARRRKNVSRSLPLPATAGHRARRVVGPLRPLAVHCVRGAGENVTAPNFRKLVRAARPAVHRLLRDHALAKLLPTTTSPGGEVRVWHGEKDLAFSHQILV